MDHGFNLQTELRLDVVGSTFRLDVTTIHMIICFGPTGYDSEAVGLYRWTVIVTCRQGSQLYKKSCTSSSSTFIFTPCFHLVAYCPLSKVASMARPVVHLTPQAKLQAQREKRKRYYQK